MNGKLGQMEAGTSSFTTLYSAPPTVDHAVVNITVCNTNNSEANIFIALAMTLAPNTADFIEYSYPIPARGHLERTALVLSKGENILIRSDSPGVVCRAHGFEKGA